MADYTLKSGKQSAAGELYARAKAKELEEYPQTEAKLTVVLDGQTVEVKVMVTGAISGAHAYLRPELDSESSIALRKEGQAWVRVKDTDAEAKAFRDDFLAGDKKLKAKIEGELEELTRKKHDDHMKGYPGWTVSYRDGVARASKIEAPKAGTQAEADKPAEAPNET